MDSKRNMGKDDIYQNKRGDINGDQFAFNAQRYNHRMEEEELRLLSSLGLTKEDIMTKQTQTSALHEVLRLCFGLLNVKDSISSVS